MKDFKLTKIVATFMFVCLSSVLMSQSGPELPCPECSEMQYKPLPKSGNWYNPEQSGVGFNFEIQNTTILGYYYGYTEAGDSMWAMFSGKLTKVDDGDALWTITTDLVEASGGQCINCNYQFYDNLEKIGDIELTFNRLGHASYQINEGDSQNIVPLYFGYQPVQSVYNETNGNITVPEIEGWWLMYWVEYDESQLPKYYRDNYEMLYIYKANKPQIEISHDIEFKSKIFPVLLETYPGPTFECSYTGENITRFNRCSISIFGKKYFIPLTNLTGDRIFGEAEDGSTVEFVRIELDDCAAASGTVSNPDFSGCINTRTRFE